MTALFNQQRKTLNVILLLVLTRILLNVPAIIGANLFPLADGIPFGFQDLDPRHLPGIWARWDSGYYLRIADSGYSLHGPEVAFFPAYPFLMRLFAFFDRSFVVWSGYLISNLAFVLATLLLWLQTRKQFGESIAWATIVTLSVFPTSLFFSAVYTESLFLLSSVLVFWFSTRKRYLLAGLSVCAASITRPTGVLLVIIPLVDLLLNEKARSWPLVVKVVSASCAGLGAYGLYLWTTQGSPLASALALQNFNRAFALPWRTIVDSLVVMTGQNEFRSNWFMRATSAEDLLATLLVIGCTAMAIPLLQKSLALYSAAALLVLLTSHGPYTLGLWSMSRYVLGLFPCFIVLGILLHKTGLAKHCIWASSLITLMFLTAWFASGRWVA